MPRIISSTLVFRTGIALGAFLASLALGPARAATINALSVPTFPLDTGLWSDPTHWDLGRAPITGDDVVFGASPVDPPGRNVYDLGAGVQLRSITVTSSVQSFRPTGGPIALQSGGAITIDKSSNTLEILPGITLNGPATISLAATVNVVISDGLSLNGAITGTGPLTLSNTGRPDFLELNAVNTYTGATIIAGTARVLFNPSGAIPSGSALTVNAGASAGFSQPSTVASLSGTGDMEITGMFTVGGDNSSTAYTGVITGNSGFTKTGSGTLTLSGAHTYTGNTLVSAGTLTVNGSLAASSTVTVAAGATLNGTGTINGNILFVPGSTIAGVTVNGTTTQLNAPAITSATSIATITYGAALASYTITATNTANTVVSYSITAGSLPTGVTLNASTGVISGTPTVAGIFNVTIGATNAAGTGTQGLAITINPKALTVSGLSVTSRAYDGTTTAALTGTGSLVGIVGADTVTLTGTASGTFATAAPGTGKTVTIAGLSLGGAQAANYTLTAPTATADITAKALTVSGISANSKSYDGTTSATLTGSGTLVGVVGGDAVTLSGSPTGTFATAALGTGKTVTIAGLSLGGANAGNYSLTAPTATANITAKALTVSGLSAANKPYDGTTAATLSGTAALVGVVGADVVSLTGVPSGAFADANAGTGKSVVVSGLSLTGANAGSYTLTAPVLTANIGALPASVTLGNLSRVYTGAEQPVSVTTSPGGLTVQVGYRLNNVPTSPVFAGRYEVNATVMSSGYSGGATATLVILPAIVAAPASAKVTFGGTATFSVTASGGDVRNPLTYQWQKNGLAISGANGSTLALANVQPADLGFYAVVVSAAGASVTVPARLEPDFVGKTAGAASEIAADIRHPNGNTYDQVALTGAIACVKADAGQVTRVSYLDLTNDIVQVEFSGAGMLTIALDGASGPAAAANYDQPGVLYMKGHATLTVVGADATTNLGIFSVGKATAVNQSLFKTNVTYDGWADVALVSIASTDGKFGGVRTGNVSYFNTKGLTGVYAPAVQLAGPLVVGDINGSDTAGAVLVTGAVTDAAVAGGDLLQANGGNVEVNGMTRLQFTAGSNSHGAITPAQANRARLMRNGVDVTSQLVP